MVTAGSMVVVVGMLVVECISDLVAYVILKSTGVGKVIVVVIVGIISHCDGIPSSDTMPAFPVYL